MAGATFIALDLATIACYYGFNLCYIHTWDAFDTGIVPMGMGIV